MSKEILGIWNLDPEDIQSQKIYGNVSIEFKNTGDMVYTIHLNDKDQKMFMTYKVEDSFIITNQSSFPNKEETEFRILSNGKLELYFEGIKSTYIRLG